MMGQTERVARRAGLPTAGCVQGVVTLVQEDRFRLEDDAGRGYLFTLGRATGRAVADLYRWSSRRIPVVFQGPPDLGGVVIAMREDGERSSPHRRG
jgi:hypothetical protein